MRSRGQARERGFKVLLENKIAAWSNGQKLDEAVPGVEEEAWNLESDFVDFPVTLSQKERKIVHSVSSRLGLFHVSRGEGDSRYISISKSGNFGSAAGDVYDEVESYKCPWYDETVVKPRTKPLFYEMSAEEIEVKQTTVDRISKRGGHEDMRFKIQFDSIEQVPEDLSAWAGPNYDDPSQLPAFVDTQALLAELAGELDRCTEFAFDAEMHTYRSYYGMVCLLQLSVNGKDYLVDTISLWDSVGPVLGPYFANPAILKIGHAVMGMDVPSLFRDFGIILVNVFDTQEAAVCLGSHRISLASLLQRWKCPLTTEIAESKNLMRGADWRKRPLPVDMLRYAHLDVHYLPVLYLLQVRALLVLSCDESKFYNQMHLKKELEMRGEDIGGAGGSIGTGKEKAKEKEKEKEKEMTRSQRKAQARREREKNGHSNKDGTKDGNKESNKQQKQPVRPKPAKPQPGILTAEELATVDEDYNEREEMDAEASEGAVVWGDWNFDVAEDAQAGRQKRKIVQGFHSGKDDKSDNDDDDMMPPLPAVGRVHAAESWDISEGAVPDTERDERDPNAVLDVRDLGDDDDVDDDAMWDGWGGVSEADAPGSGSGGAAGKEGTGSPLGLELGTRAGPASGPRVRSETYDTAETEVPKVHPLARTFSQDSDDNEATGRRAGGDAEECLGEDNDDGDEQEFDGNAPIDINDLDGDDEEDDDLWDGWGGVGADDGKTDAQPPSTCMTSAEIANSGSSDACGNARLQSCDDMPSHVSVGTESVQNEAGPAEDCSEQKKTDGIDSKKIRGKSKKVFYDDLPPIPDSDEFADATLDELYAVRVVKDGREQNGCGERRNVQFRFGALVLNRRFHEVRSAFSKSAYACVSLWRTPPPPRAPTASESLQRSQAHCRQWLNRRRPEEGGLARQHHRNGPAPAYTKAAGYRERNSTKHNRWTLQKDFVFQRLYEWREQQAYQKDESQAFICPTSLLLDAAERLPTCISSLNILISPLPHSMRPPKDAKAEAEAGSDDCVDLIGAVAEALREWGTVRPSGSGEEDAHGQGQ